MRDTIEYDRVPGRKLLVTPGEGVLAAVASQPREDREKIKLENTQPTAREARIGIHWETEWEDRGKVCEHRTVEIPPGEKVVVVMHRPTGITQTKEPEIVSITEPSDGSEQDESTGKIGYGDVDAWSDEPN